MRVPIFIISIFFCTFSYGQDYIDIIVVKKSERILYAVKDDKIRKKYKIFLGKNPIGHKKMQGDKKTPEGYYYIDGKKIAEKKNLDPGNHIAIHGLPEISLLSQYLYDNSDWTDGCIALDNEDMKELWSMTHEGTQILIKP